MTATTSAEMCAGGAVQLSEKMTCSSSGGRGGGGVGDEYRASGKSFLSGLG